MSSTPYLGQISMFAFDFPPRGWANCMGQLMAIQSNQALFSLLGTTYGGNGQTTFGLPNLQGRVPVHLGGGIAQGQIGGEAVHTLIVSELPSHTHTVNASNNTADQTYPANDLWAKAGSAAGYYTGGNAPMAPGSITNSGGSQAHENMQPYLVINYSIALQGIFPSRN